jgi:hypothetical protein
MRRTRRLQCERHNCLRVPCERHNGHAPRLEREAGRNVEVMWIMGRLVPDHKTIADFRKDNGPAGGGLDESARVSSGAGSSKLRASTREKISGRDFG